MCPGAFAKLRTTAMAKAFHPVPYLGYGRSSVHDDRHPFDRTYEIYHAVLTSLLNTHALVTSNRAENEVAADATFFFAMVYGATPSP